MYDPVILYDDGTPRTKHVLGNIEIAVEGGGVARAACTFVVFQAVPGDELRAVLSGRYHDRFEVADGEWRFVERVVHPDDLEAALLRAFEHDGPALVEVMVARQELSVPPTITAEQIKGFTLYATRTILSGRVEELVDLATTNITRRVFA